MKGLVVIIVGAFVLGAAVLAVRSAGAQDGEGERPGDKFIAKTAENLGVGAKELTTAMTDAQFEIIDEAVAAGNLTEEQAAKLRERIEEYGPLSVIGWGQRYRDHVLCKGARLVIGAAAEALGEEPADVAEAVRSGESLAEQAEAHGMRIEDFTAALLDAIKGKLDAKVSDGTITQSQADRIFAGIEEHIDRIVSFEGQGGDGPCHRLGNGEKLEASPVR